MVLAMPLLPNFKRSSFTLEYNTQVFESPITRTPQTLLLAGDRWMLSATLPRMNRGQLAAWEAFFAQCEGRANSFYGFDPDKKTPRGAAAYNPGTPLVKGASQTGSSLLIDGCPISVVGWLKAGDHFSVNSELKMLTSDANTDGSGEVTLNFKPAMRESPADNAAITVANCQIAMKMIEDAPQIETDANGISNEISFSAIEDLTA